MVPPMTLLRNRWMRHLAAWILGVTAFRVGLVPPQDCPPVTRDQVEAALHDATSWATANLRPDGTFLYRYDRSTETDLGTYNLIRHAGMVSSLYSAAATPDDPWVRTAESGLDYMLANLIQIDDSVAFTAPGFGVRTGATALMVSSMVYRRRLTGRHDLDSTMRSAGRFLRSQQESDGAVRAFWDRTTGQPVPDRYGPFATGETFWALALLDQEFPSEGWADAASLTGRYIVEGRRAKEGYILRLPDHWAAYGFDALDRTPDPGEREYLRRLAGDMALMSRVESQRRTSGLQSFIRRDQALGAGVGAMGEGTAALWRVSPRVESLTPVRAELEQRLMCVAGLMVKRQVRPGEGVPPEEAGAWFRRDVTQIDDQQHSISALAAIIGLFDSADPQGRPLPMAALSRPRRGAEP